MKVDTIALLGAQPTQSAQSAQNPEMPVISVDDIKTILYLGIRGEIRLEPATKHAVDTYA